MDLTPYVSNLRHELAIAADAGGDDARALAERLTAPLESAVRLLSSRFGVGLECFFQIGCQPDSTRLVASSSAVGNLEFTHDLVSC